MLQVNLVRRADIIPVHQRIDGVAVRYPADIDGIKVNIGDFH